MSNRTFRKKNKTKRGGKEKKTKRIQQKIYNMKGCSKTRSKKLTGGQSYPIAPFSWKQMQQRGGNCSACGSQPVFKGGSCGSCNVMKGGSFYKPPSPIPGPFVGKAWTPSVAGWPGVDGVSGNRNYLANNLYNAGDPQTMMKLGGSKKNKRKHHRKTNPRIKGGGLFPQDLINLGRDASFNFKSAYNALGGYTAPVNPSPYKDQLSGSISANRIIV